MSRLPLYREVREARLAPANDGHAGLWWSKFFDQWTEKFTIVEPDRQSNRPGGKHGWIDNFAQKDGRASKLGSRAHLNEYHERRSLLFQTLGAKPVRLELTGPFVTGMGLEHPVENGFLWHHSLGVPYLPGSAVKGVVRGLVEDVLATHGSSEDWQEVLPDWSKLEANEREKAQRKVTARIFGPPPGTADLKVGSVIFFDAVPLVPVALSMEIMTPHYGPWYQASDPAQSPPADWYSPTPIPFLAVAPGAIFAFAVAPRPGAPAGVADCKAVHAWLVEALAWLGAGAKTAIGFGRFEDPSTARTTAPDDQETGNLAPRPGPTPWHYEGEPVEVLDRQGGDALVRFESGDIEWVDASKLRR